jgi:glycosyltransferase involved in cell wall biosynthesis
MIRLVCFLRDPLPPARSDVLVLFGEVLPHLGVETLLIGQALRGAPTMSASGNWHGEVPMAVGSVDAGRLGDPLRAFQDIGGLWRARHKPFDLIQVRDKIRTGLIMSLYARMIGKSFVYWMSFPFVESYRERCEIVGRSQGVVRWLFNFVRARLASLVFYRWVAPAAQHLFVQSEAMLEFMVQNGIPRERLTSVPMGVHLPRLESVIASDKFKEKFAHRRVVCYSGMLGRSRQSDFLIDVIRRVRTQVPNALLLLAGDGDSADEAAWIRQRILDLNASDDVLLTGWLSQEQSFALVKAAEVGLSPIPRGPVYDVSSPTKVVEYLALGIPCVANDIPDQKFVIEHSGGGVCVAFDVPAFAEAVTQMLGQPEAARDMGQRGARWVKEHRSYDAIASDVAQVYKRLVPSASVRPAAS